MAPILALDGLFCHEDGLTGIFGYDLDKEEIACRELQRFVESAPTGGHLCDGAIRWRRPLGLPSESERKGEC